MKDSQLIIVPLYMITLHNPAYKTRGEFTDYEDKARVRHKEKITLDCKLFITQSLS